MIDASRRDEILRYLGYDQHALAPSLMATIDDTIERALTELHPRWTWLPYEIREVQEGYEVVGTTLVLPGNSVRDHLLGASQVALMAVTAGPLPDIRQEQLKHVDPIRALVYDACATEVVERAADECEAEIVSWAGYQGLKTTWRFSPGYGDLPLTVQPDLLRILRAEQRLGITLTDRLLMVPMKSVTAIVGLFTHIQPQTRNRCDECSLAEICKLKAEGTPCWGEASPGGVPIHG